MLLLTILASGDSRLWPWSSPPGDTCWSTDWLDGMALLLWWLMVVEEVTSPGPWLYRTERQRHTEADGWFFLFGVAAVASYIRVQHQPRSENRPTSHQLPICSLTPAVEGQSKQTH